jgi:L-alanine-DL-glutamate epimerase-like enolase superfamily enzyme
MVGEDPLRIEAVVAKLRTAAGSAKPGGIFNLAHSALGMALWDIRGKALTPRIVRTGGSLERIRHIGDPGSNVTARQLRGLPLPSGAQNLRRA